ncbi:MAG: tetratricopeptide repeat protein [Candidatus Delongbacteria bacterium]|nr:tetratricopeptide repeat protein [Candidatus Delongbacteria bacterium]
MRSFIVIFFILSIFSLYAESDPCADIKKAYDKKIEEWKEIETEMKNDETSKKRYEELLPEYNKKWEEAQKLKGDLKQCDEESKNVHKAFYNKGINLKKEKKYEEALEQFKKALEVEKDFEDAFNQICLVYIELGQFSNFEKEVEKIKDKDTKGKLYHAAGKKVLHSKPDIAIKYYKEMANYYKPDKAYYLIAGIYVTKKDDPKTAITYYKKAMKLDPKDHKIFNALGATIVELSGKTTNKVEKDNLLEEAASILLQGVKLGKKGYTKYYEICIRLAQIYNIQGKATSALTYADMAISNNKDKKYSLAHLEKGIALIKMKQYSQAKKMLLIAQEDFQTKNAVKYWLDEIAKRTKK